ncbi:hypothetical protein ES708_26162 [subsurface metagenome]
MGGPAEIPSRIGNSDVEPVAFAKPDRAGRIRIERCVADDIIADKCTIDKHFRAKIHRFKTDNDFFTLQ